MGKTNIPWATDVWNPIVGCSKVSAGCAHCYAERMALRLKAMGRPEYVGVVDCGGRWTGKVNFVELRLGEPYHWRKPRRIFVCSMSDLFHESVPAFWIEDVFEVIENCPQHTFMVLTKRAERMADWSGHYLAGVWPRNAWAIVSAEDQETLSERILHLLQVDAVVRGVSIEPMLGPVDLNMAMFGVDDLGYGIDWVICGGESGPGRRPFEAAWAEDLYRQCREAGVAFWGKQGSGPRPGIPLLIEGREVHEWPEVAAPSAS